MRYLHGGGQLLPALEKGLAGLEADAHAVVEVPCAEGFGERDEARVLEVAREQLPPDAEVGGTVMTQDHNGRRVPLVVLHLDDAVARLDSNHPLAGKDLVFDVTILRVEAATAEEIAHGHVH